MMGIETIRALNAKVGRQARRAHRKPKVFTQDTIDLAISEVKTDGRPRALGPIPFLGDYRPSGWRLVDDLFVDKSGFGREGEPALTIRGFCSRLEAGRGYGVIEEGQFQVVVGVFEPEKGELH